MSDLTPNSDPSQETSAYVRVAKPSETSAIAAVLTRAFARDPVMNWLGGVRALVPADHKGDADDGDDGNARHTLARLQRFLLGSVKRVETTGLIVVVVEKEGKARAEGDAEGEGEGEGEGEKERIVGCALWVKPAVTKDSFPRMFLRVAKLVWGWGLGGIKVRLFFCGVGSPPRVMRRRRAPQSVTVLTLLSSYRGWCSIGGYQSGRCTTRSSTRAD